MGTSGVKVWTSMVQSKEIKWTTVYLQVGGDKLMKFVSVHPFQEGPMSDEAVDLLIADCGFRMHTAMLTKALIAHNVGRAFHLRNIYLTPPTAFVRRLTMQYESFSWLMIAFNTFLMHWISILLAYRNVSVLHMGDWQIFLWMCRACVHDALLSHHLEAEWPSDRFWLWIMVAFCSFCNLDHTSLSVTWTQLYFVPILKGLWAFCSLFCNFL